MNRTLFSRLIKKLSAIPAEKKRKEALHLPWLGVLSPPSFSRCGKGQSQSYHAADSQEGYLFIVAHGKAR